MNQDAENLRLLSIFHYVVAGVAAFCSFLPLLYAVLGFVFVALSHHPPANPSQEVPPAALGWAFVGLGFFFSCSAQCLLSFWLLPVDRFPDESVIGSHSSLPVSNASLSHSGRFLEYLRLSCSRSS